MAIGLTSTSANLAVLTLACIHSHQFRSVHWQTRERVTQGKSASQLLSAYGNQDA